MQVQKDKYGRILWGTSFGPGTIFSSGMSSINLAVFKSFSIFCIIFLTAVYGMGLDPEGISHYSNERKLVAFDLALMNAVVSDDPSCLPLATLLVKEDIIRLSYSDTYAFKGCIHKIATKSTVPLTYFEALDIMLQCDNLDFSSNPVEVLYLATCRMSLEISSKLISRLVPTDKFLEELMEIIGRRGRDLDVGKLSGYLSWSLGKVSVKNWLYLLHHQMPIDPEEQSDLRILLFPLFVQDVSGLREKIWVADYNLMSNAVPFLNLVLKEIETALLVSGLEGEFWLPEELVKKIILLIHRLGHPKL